MKLYDNIIIMASRSTLLDLVDEVDGDHYLEADIPDIQLSNYSPLYCRVSD